MHLQHICYVVEKQTNTEQTLYKHINNTKNGSWKFYYCEIGKTRSKQ